MTSGQTAPTVQLSDGHAMPLLGLGTWPMNGKEATEAVAGAIEAGYRSLDTAAKYENEEAVGQGIRASGLDRAELFVTTKLRGADQGSTAARDGLRASLDRLGLDYVDLYLIHWPLPRLGRYLESYETMLELAAEGLVRSLGVSNFKPAHLDRLREEVGAVPAVNQIQLSPAIARVRTRAEMDRRGVVTESWRPLGLDEGLLDEPVVTELAEAHGRTPAQVVLRWHVQQGIVTIPKSADPERQRANLDIFDFELSEDAMSRLAALDRGEDAAWDSDEHEEF